MKRLNNKGISLVELVIAIGVFSLTMIAMFGALSMTTKLFGRNNEEINVQNEATTLMNQLSNIVVEAKYGTSVLESDGSETKSFVVLKEDSFVVIWRDLTTHDLFLAEWPDSGISTLTNAGIKAEFEKDERATVDQKAAYCKSLFDAVFNSTSSTIDLSGADRGRFLLAENVESMIVTPNNVYGYMGVSLNVHSNSSTLGFAASKNINIRNIYKAEGSATGGGKNPAGGGGTPAGGGGAPAGGGGTPAGGGGTPAGGGGTPAGGGGTPAGGEEPPSSEATPAGILSISHSTNSWGNGGENGYYIEVKVTVDNKTSADIDGWKIRVKFSGDVDSLVNSWNGNFKIENGNELVITPNGNSRVTAGGSVGPGGQLKTNVKNISVVSCALE